MGDLGRSVSREVDPQKDTYSSRVSCVNCGHEERIDIPKGQRVDDTKCPRCGCGSLKRVGWSVP